jgi:uncharacterized membrane protein YqaE (UPF0057 family)
MSKLCILEYSGNSISKILHLPAPQPRHPDSINLRNIITIELAPYFPTSDIPYYYALLNGKLLTNPLQAYSSLPELSIIKIYCPLHGGGNIISDIINCVMNIGKFFVILIQMIEWLGKMIAWVFKTIGVLMHILNPANVFGDIANTAMLIANAVVLAPIQAVFAFIKMICNKIFGNIFGIFWGWDSTRTADDVGAAYFKEPETHKKCYTHSGNIPFSILLATVFCPPIGVFMEYGITGWFHILLATGLTCIYYFPGLLYALLIIYT